MRAPDPIEATRVVAAPDALDRLFEATPAPGEAPAAAALDGAVVLRLAPDDALVVSDDLAAGEAVRALLAAELAGAGAGSGWTVERDAGWVGWRMPSDRLRALLATQLEWVLPGSGQLAQGMVAGVPAKVWTGDPGLLLVARPLAHELRARIGGVDA